VASVTARKNRLRTANHFSPEVVKGLLEYDDPFDVTGPEYREDPGLSGRSERSWLPGSLRGAYSPDVCRLLLT
jgi:hypothetical protein